MKKERLRKLFKQWASMAQARRFSAPWIVAMASAALIAPHSVALAESPTIVLIGGMNTSLPDAEHDYADGVLKIERLIEASPEFANVKPTVKVFPVGFPEELSEIDDASVVVLYFGTQRTDSGSMNPVQDSSVKQALNELMERGVGLVALHQSFTVSQQNREAPFLDWLGGVRIAATDYTVETAPIELAAEGHPIVNGVEPFIYLDEFYPTIEFDKASGVTPILHANIHVQHKRTGPVFEEPAKKRVVAWTKNRSDGGRAFAFSGGHYLASFDQPQVRTMILNAILWAAHEEVPKTGVSTSVPTLWQPGEPERPPEPYRVVFPAADVELLPQPWGELQWFASRPLGNSTTMTVGQATISPGKFNPPHWHPNCDEILHVVSGHIMHRVGDKEYEMRAGDTVVIPQGTIHNARNIGNEDAVLMVSFNSADRVAIGE
jgi:quercetin dioxygenase-like cupin family protein/type 1 glutamine amidotransferase